MPQRVYDTLVIATTDGRETVVDFDSEVWTDRVEMVQAAWREIDRRRQNDYRPATFTDSYGRVVGFSPEHVVSVRA